jgi:phage tail sheath protein FI
LLCIIGALCKEAKLDYSKPAKTAALIQSTAARMGVSLGETTIEGYLKKIPDALSARGK